VEWSWQEHLEFVIGTKRIPRLETLRLNISCWEQPFVAARCPPKQILLQMFERLKPVKIHEYTDSAWIRKPSLFLKEKCRSGFTIRSGAAVEWSWQEHLLPHPGR
jgi:hypothetical protein